MENQIPGNTFPDNQIELWETAVQSFYQEGEIDEQSLRILSELLHTEEYRNIFTQANPDSLSVNDRISSIRKAFGQIDNRNRIKDTSPMNILEEKQEQSYYTKLKGHVVLHRLFFDKREALKQPAASSVRAGSRPAGRLFPH